MNITTLFCGCLGRPNKRSAMPSKQPEAVHNGRVFQFIEKLPVSRDMKTALHSRFGRQEKAVQQVKVQQPNVKQIETALVSMRNASEKDPAFMSQLKDLLICSVYHSKVNEFGEHLALEGKKFPASYLHDMGAVMQAHVKGTEKNGVFTPAGGASNMFTNETFHILLAARTPVPRANVKSDAQRPLVLPCLDYAENKILNRQAEKISDEILLNWFKDDTPQIYWDVMNALTKVTNEHMPQATPAHSRETRARG